MELLKQLIEIRGASSDEGRVKDFIFEIKTNDELVAFATKLEIYV